MAQKPSYEEFERISKERHDLELIYNSVTNPVMVLDPDQNILSVNLATERLIGISKSELLNKKCYDVMHSENCVTQSGCCPFQKVFSGEVANNIEAEIELKNESFLVICTPVFDKNGQLDKVFHVSTNVTLLKKNEKKALMLLEATRTIPLSKGFTEAAKSIYDICKDHIGATCGYVAMKSENEKDNDLLFLDDGGLPCFVDPSLPMPIRGLRKESYETGEVAYSNDFMNSSYKKYMPEGHMVLENVLFSPLKFGDEMPGVIGLANKPGGFKEYDIEVAKAFGEIAGLALRHSVIKEELVEKEHFSSNLLDNSPNPILVIDSEKTVIYGNKAFENLTGHNLKEVLGIKPPYPWWTSDTLKKTQSDLESAFDKGAYRVEEKFQSKLGEIFYVEITSAPIMKDGVLDYYLANWIDITDQKRAQEELERSERLHRATIENISDAVFITDNKGKFTFICPNTHLIFGYTSDEVADLKFIDKLFEKRIFNTQELQKNKELSNISVKIKNKDGHYRYLLVNVKKVKIDTGSILYTCRDVTEKKLVEEALIETQKMFSKAFEKAPIVLVISDVDDGTILEINGEFLKSMGYTRKEAIGRKTTDLGIVSKKDRKSVMALIKKDGHVTQAEVTFYRADGSPIQCLYSAELVELNGTRRLLSTAIDITQRKYQEDLIKQKQADLETYSNKLKKMNTALNVLIDHRGEEKETFKKDILKNFEKLVFPYFPTSKSRKTQEELSTILSIIERNVKEILLKGDNKNLSLYVGLTPMESQIAHMIKEGKASKDIANTLKMSVHTVYFHRENIRKKLNLTQTNANLKTYLQSKL